MRPVCRALAAVLLLPACRAAGESAAKQDLFGDPLPPHAVARLGTLRYRAVGARAIAFAPDGQRIVAGGYEKPSLVLWNVSDGTPEKYWRAPENRPTSVGCLGFSPDGKSLMSSGLDFGTPGPVVLWDAARGTQLRQIDVKALASAWSPDGRHVASACSDKKVRVHRVVDGQEVQSFDWQGGNPLCVGFSPDGTTLAAGGYADKGPLADDQPTPGKMRIWNAAGGGLGQELRGHTRMVVGLDFSPNGKTLASGSWDGTVRLWDSQTGREKACLEAHRGLASSVRFSPKGGMLASCGNDGNICLWDPRTGRRLRKLFESGMVEEVAFSRDGRTLASRGSRIGLWDVETGADKTPPDAHRGIVRGVAFAADGKTAISSGDSTIRWWDVTTMKQTRAIEVRDHPCAPMAVSPNRRMIATAAFNNCVRLWDTATGEQLSYNLEHDREITALCFHASGRRIDVAAFGFHDETAPTAGPNGRAYCWDLLTGQKTQGLDSPLIQAFFLSPDEKIDVSCGVAETVVFEAATNKRLLTLTRDEDHPLAAAAFSPNGEFLIANALDEKKVHALECWNMRSRERVWSVKHDPTIGDIVFSPDGKLVASAEYHVVSLWTPDSGKKLAEFRGHRDFVRCLAFSPDGRRLVSGSQDTTILVWDVESAIKEGYKPRARTGAKKGTNR